MAQEVKQRRTLVKFGVPVTEYIEGEGAKTSWKLLTVKVGTAPNGEPITTDCFYCEWLNAFGATAIQRQAEGTIRPARVRMKFVQCVYAALLNGGVRVYLHGKQDEQNTFTLSSAPDNYVNGNKLLEFNVKQYTAR